MVPARPPAAAAALFTPCAQERITGQDLYDLLAATRDINSAYNAEIVTEFPYNGFGILEKVRRKTTIVCSPSQL